MQRHKRHDTLTQSEKDQFDAAARRFKEDMRPLLIGLTAFGDGYKSIHAITEAIDAAYDVLEVDKPVLVSAVHGSFGQARRVKMGNETGNNSPCAKIEVIENNELSSSR